MAISPPLPVPVLELRETKPKPVPIGNSRDAATSENSLSKAVKSQSTAGQELAEQLNRETKSRYVKGILVERQSEEFRTYVY